MKTKVAIVEDNRGTREYLSALLSGSDGIELSGVYADGQSALENIPQSPPDVLLIDIGLPDISGIDVIKDLKERFPQVEILVLTIQENRDQCFAALQSGATGYLVKGAASTEIIDAVAMLMVGGAPMSPTIARYVIEEFQDLKSGVEASALTKREREVLLGVAEGLTEKNLASSLALSPHTVHTHIKNIYRKLQVKSRAEAVLKARNKGLV